MSWLGGGKVDGEIEVNGQPAGNTESGRFKPGSLTAPPNAFSVTVGLRRGRLLCTWTHPHFPLVLNSEPQWLSTYPGATKLAHRLWHPIMCLFKTFSPGDRLSGMSQFLCSPSFRKDPAEVCSFRNGERAIPQLR